MKITNEQIVAAVNVHNTIAAAAKSLHRSESWIYERMQSAEYKELQNKTVMAQLEHISGKLQDRLTDAIDTISDVMQNVTTPPSIRLAAANSIISHYINLTEKSRAAKKIVREDRQDAQWDFIEDNLFDLQESRCKDE